MKLEWFFGACEQNCNQVETIECCCAQRRKQKHFLALVQTEISARFCGFRNITMLQKQPKRRLQADIALGINKHGRHNWHQWSQTLRTNYEQLRLNTGKKIKTASLNSKFTDSYKKACLRYHKSRIQLRYCYLWLIYYTFYRGLKFCSIGFTVASNQLMTAVSAVDQCQHQQEN